MRETDAWRNGEARRLEAVTSHDLVGFRTAVVSGVETGQRVVTFFGQQLPSTKVRLFAVLADDARRILLPITTEVDRDYPSLTPACPQVHLFEREIYEQLGVVPTGHPWLKSVRAHDFAGEAPEENSKHTFFSMDGEEVHEVAVGPVHAGVIEPGHFRFQCHGEVVHHLEIQLGYQHRGVEEALVGGPHKRTMLQMETIAGDSTIAHATAYCQAVESLGGIEAPPRARALRAIALELERLANHVGDMGALANDVGFLPTASFCGRLRGDFLNMTALICGSRLGRGLVRPGGVAFDVSRDMVDDLLLRLSLAERDVEQALKLFFTTRSVVARLEGIGPVSAEACRDLGIVGLAARASGVVRDARTDHPSGAFLQATVPISTCQTGDVYGRARVRQLEIERSMVFVREQLQRLPEGPTRVACPPANPDQFVAIMVEGWRGEVVHAVLTDERGRFARYKVTDPSFHNWTALALALRGQQISDFPLCNKSFNLSYCGFDL